MKPPVVKMYTCGPTVYSYPTIGNWRTYVTSDLLVRTLKLLGYQVDFVMNLTDVGHLTGDNLGDADTGEDRLEKAAKRERKTAWEVAKFYSEDFERGFSKLNLVRPMVFSKATDHIKEQIDLVERIEKAGFTYKIVDGIYFDVVAYEAAGNVYGELSNLDEIKKGARIEVNQEKKNPRDFALWKFSPTNEKRDMEWPSPWGVGFPGWHIECSAMSMKYLGEQLDIHVGGEDLKSTHHPNEIAQSEAATGKRPFCKYWVHGAFLTIDGGRMGKSEGNAYTLADVAAKGFDLMGLRYFYLTGHYRKQLNFTWEALDGARTTLNKLRHLVIQYREKRGRTQFSPEKLVKVNGFKKDFGAAVDDDLNMPQALAVVWEVVKSSISDYDKYELLVSFDEVMGLGLAESRIQKVEVSEEVKKLLEKRETLRRDKKFGEADEVRVKIEELGYRVEDTPDGVRVGSSN